MVTATDPDQLLGVSDAARRLGVSSDTVRAWSRLGKLEALRTAGGVRLFRRRDVERLREQRAKGE